MGLIWRPILAGIWKQHETSDGTYNFHDLVEVNRVLDIRDENQRRARMAAERKAAGKNQRPA